MSKYYDVHEKIFQCGCGWSGTMNECGQESFDALVEIYCPKCGIKLDNVEYPTVGETEKANANGKNVNPLDLLAARLKKGIFLRWRERKLKKASQLPNLKDESLEFVWDRAEKSALDSWYVIRLGERIVWKEPALYEDGDRFPVVVDIFKKKYGPRFKEMGVTWFALHTLMGDKLSYWRYVRGCPVIEGNRKRWDLTKD